MKKCREVKDWKGERLGSQNLLRNSVISGFLFRVLLHSPEATLPLSEMVAGVSAYEILTPQPRSSSVLSHRWFTKNMPLFHHLALCTSAEYCKFRLSSKYSLIRGSYTHHASELPARLLLQCRCCKLLPPSFPCDGILPGGGNSSLLWVPHVHHLKEAHTLKY